MNWFEKLIMANKLMPDLEEELVLQKHKRLKPQKEKIPLFRTVNPTSKLKPKNKARRKNAG